MIDKRKFDRVFLNAVDELRKLAPKDTRNLADNSIRYKWNSPTQFEIYINVGDTEAFVESHHYEKGEAPYTPFTNEPWVSPKWNGKKNPNENWWNNAIDFVVKYIAKELGGQLE